MVIAYDRSMKRRGYVSKIDAALVQAVLSPKTVEVFFEALEKSSDVEAVDNRVVDFDADGHHPP